MRNKAAKQKSKKKATDNAFGCDLIEHLQSTGQDVPQVLKKCAEFIEKHGIVDGIYRLSGVTSNIQRLRQEFCSEACPDLTKEVYLQDIHCVGSLCKLYFRELPNPLLTYELYTKFTDSVSVQGDHEKIVHLQKVIKELPNAHFRTLEYLTKHLTHLATLSTKTNMHTRNLALVWAPNLLRSKDVEVSSGNGNMAFQEVRVQQSIIEFILNHTEQIFNGGSIQVKPKESLMCGEKYATLPISGPSAPMKLMSLEEAQARSLGPNHPVHRERQRENSLPDPSTAQLYHTVIDIDSKKKFSGKSKKWKSIFNLGRSVDAKGKLSRNGSVFIRAQGVTEKAKGRKSRSMESLCSLPTDDDRTGGRVAVGPGSIFAPDVKSRTLGSDSLFDLSEDEPTWEIKGIRPSGATAGWTTHMDQDSPLGTSLPAQKPLPEQLKVFKGEDVKGFKPTSPKNRRTLYSSHSSSSRPSFPGSFFPLESSPRHQRRVLNISEPFAVSVPLRVSAVISSNSTPCRSLAKKIPEPAFSGKSNTVTQLEYRRQEETEKINRKEGSSVQSENSRNDGSQESQRSESEDSFDGNTGQKVPSCGDDLHIQSTPKKLDRVSSHGKGLLADLSPELKTSQPEIKLLDETFKPVFGTQKSYDGLKLTPDVKSKRSQSSPSLTLLCKEMSSLSFLNHLKSGSESAKKQPSESDLLFSLRKDFDVAVGGSTENIQPSKITSEIEKTTQPPPKKIAVNNKVTENLAPLHQDDTLTQKSLEIPAVHPHKNNSLSQESMRKNLVLELDSVPRLSVCVEERRSVLELEDEGGHAEELDLVDPWDEVNSAKQWVTSPLHSPDVEELFKQLAPSCPERGATVPEESNISAALSDINKSSTKPSPTKSFSGNIPPGSKAEAKWMYAPTRTSNTSQAHKSHNLSKHKNTASSQRFHRQMSHEAATLDKKEENTRHRPYSLNLDLGPRCIRDISNQQNLGSSEFCQKGMQPGIVNSCLSELELFLNDNQAPLRRNSAPVSVSSVRTAFMIKTCQAKAVPVVPPKVQYSQIPHSRLEKDTGNEEETECSVEKSIALPPLVMSELKEELENKEPAPKPVKAAHVEKMVETAGELPVITRRHTPSLEVFVDAPRPNKSNLLQRSSFRNRQRPQSLILLSPPFPIMDYPSSGDDGKLISSIRSLNDTSAESNRVTEQVQNKMTIPKSGQRLETSTSCFYQPQRRSMIFDSRSHRQIE
ncbi:rho GTPase-activating protein 31 [Eucyclogobius newberryi]|uniref:rho GTPase-activating protein 31 n=1 Tax=Eucyclogobius newberryi TaxID=166745 RepID=UPI003B5CFE19